MYLFTVFILDTIASGKVWTHPQHQPLGQEEFRSDEEHVHQQRPHNVYHRQHTHGNKELGGGRERTSAEHHGTNTISGVKCRSA